MGKKRKGRRARGTGSIFFSKKRQVWIGRKTIGKTAKGKPQLIEVCAATQAEVIKKLAAAMPPGPDTTVAEYAERWLKALGVRPATSASYEVSVRVHIVPTLGSTRISDLALGRIERFGAELVKNGLAATSARGVIRHLGTMLGSAVREGVIASNPAVGARKPRGESKRLDPYSSAELAKIIGLAPGFVAGDVVATLAASGCRMGEALGLDVADFDPAVGTIAITKTFNFTHGLGEPKSKHSVRTIRIPESVQAVLRTTVAGRTSGPLFATANRERQSQMTVRRALARSCKLLSLPLRKPHQLRHSVATALISAQVPLGDVAKYLGDKVETIVKTYLHPTGIDPSRMLDTLLGGVKVGA